MFLRHGDMSCCFVSLIARAVGNSQLKIRFCGIYRVFLVNYFVSDISNSNFNPRTHVALCHLNGSHLSGIMALGHVNQPRERIKVSTRFMGNERINKEDSMYQAKSATYLNSCQRVLIY